MPPGIGGSGYLMVAHEATMGTFVQPAASVAVPILSENLTYTEERYVSPQLRLQTIASDAKKGYYHVEGDITMEVDPRYLPYFMHATRHTIGKSGGGPYVYTYSPSSAGSAVTGTGNNQRTMSLSVFRSGVGFGYAGCTVAGYEFTIEDAVLKVTLNILGLSEEEPANAGTPAYVAPDLLGADAHAIYVDAAGTAPGFAAADVNFNGYTFRAEFGAEAQNRIRMDRSASYIAFGETVANIETELDFMTRAEFDSYRETEFRSIRLESINGGADWASATSGVRIDSNRMFYETYDLGLEGIGDLVMAGVTGRVIGIAGGNAYQITVKSPTNIT